MLRRGLFEEGFVEIYLKGKHVVDVQRLPKGMHKAPFDRLIVAKAAYEQFPLNHF